MVRLLFAVIEAFGIAGNIMTILSTFVEAETSKTPLDWLNRHGGLLIWDVVLTILLVFLLLCLRAIEKKSKQKLVKINHNNGITQFIFRFNGDLEIGQVVTISRRNYKTHYIGKWAAWRTYISSETFAIAEVDTYDPDDHRRMTLICTGFDRRITPREKRVHKKDYRDYFMVPYVTGNTLVDTNHCYKEN